MELITTKDKQLCKKCNNLRDKKHGFHKRSKICNNCKLNLKNNIENEAICIICLWSGKNHKYKDHNCITDLNNNIIKVKYINKFDNKDNPFLINFNS
jgi:hypothetical protein